MQTSQRGIDLIKRHEGFSATPYLCPAGVWTWGYGHTMSMGERQRGGMITRGEAESLLRGDLTTAENAVNRLVTVPLTQGQFDALVSFTFNLGQGALMRSTLLRLLNSGDYANAAAQFKKWVYAGGTKLPGLVARREEERSLFVG